MGTFEFFSSRYLAIGCSFKDIYFTYRVGASTARVIVLEVCEAIWQHLQRICFPELTQAEWRHVAKVFEEKAHFPNCIGAIDGKHIHIRAPAHSGSLYFNYKKFFSMVLFAVCDANYRFLFIDVGSYGRSSDSTIYANSIFFQHLQNKALNIPPGI